MRVLDTSQVIALHDELVCATGGSLGLHDAGLLESALAAPFVEFHGVEAHPGIARKAARLCWGIIENHPFVDGNKRTGVHVMLVLLALNGVELEHTQDDLVSLAVGAARGDIDANDITEWIQAHESGTRT